MPNGVIWGGAVEGSNQLGAMVTCHAIAASPEGPAALAGAAPRANATTTNRNARGVRQRRICRVFMPDPSWVMGVERWMDAPSAFRPREFLLGLPDLRGSRDELERGPG